MGNNKGEHLFVMQARVNGYSVYRRGWPDFLIVRGPKIYGVEVKPDNRICNRLRDRGSKLTIFQQKIMSLLCAAGLKCFVWKPSSGFKSINSVEIETPWNPGIPPF